MIEESIRQKNEAQNKTADNLQSSLRVFGNRLANLPDQGSELPADRQSRLLAWTLFLLGLLMVFTEILVFTLSYDTEIRRYLYRIVPVAYFLVLVVSFFLNRLRRIRLAALMAVIGSVIAVWSVILSDPLIRQGLDLIPICYIALTLLISAFLLNRIDTFILSIVQDAALLILILNDPILRDTNWISLITFLVFMTVISLAISHIMRTDLDQIDRQAQSLLAHEAALKDLAIRDSLTGLYNRLYLDETLKREISRITRRNSTLGVIMIDIDFFKTINDTYGHGIGDEFLRQIGQILASRVRDSDIACRYGGDEFTLVMPDASLDATYERAESIRLQADEWVFEIGPVQIHSPSLSCGVAVYPIHGHTGETVLEAADHALYLAKQNGRNRTEVAEPVPTDQ
ncbi:MAG: GGDEF domain-containing protein [Clostridiaceae bacterium]|nr:GGDEF domain-containing protein [Clostridiaceae bacterium]